MLIDNPWFNLELSICWEHTFYHDKIMIFCFQKSVPGQNRVPNWCPEWSQKCPGALKMDNLWAGNSLI